MATQEGIREQIPGIPVKLVDATAAGDCFDGEASNGMVMQDILQAARYGNVAASLSVQHFGAVSSLTGRGRN